MDEAKRQENLKLMAEAAVMAETTTGCPAIVSVAQAILESAWLQVAPGNNCFGIKDTDRYPGAQYKFTKEFENGQWITHQMAFEVYPSLADCFTDHAKLITGGFEPKIRNCYAAAWEAYQLSKDVESYIRGISHYYATDPGYAEKILVLVHLPDVTAAVDAARTALQPAPAPVRETTEPQTASAGVFGIIWQLIQKFLGKSEA